jgi:CHAD domain-containing protein
MDKDVKDLICRMALANVPIELQEEIVCTLGAAAGTNHVLEQEIRHLATKHRMLMEAFCRVCNIPQEQLMAAIEEDALTEFKDVALMPPMSDTVH